MYTVMQPGEYNTRVYLSVDKLGWRWTSLTRKYIEQHRSLSE